MNITGIDAGNAVHGSYKGSDSSAGAGITGHVGDVIEGVVRKVSDEVTIDFNGKEINVSKSAVQGAREGDSVKFQIMDVSDNRIVLKAMDNSESGSQGVSTTVLETESKADSIESDVVDNSTEDNYINIENVTGDDAEAVFKMQNGAFSDPENMELDAFNRLLDAIKSKRLLELSSIEGQQEKIQQVKAAIESASIKNSLPNGISEVIAEYFVRYDIPVTQEKLEQLGNAVNQNESVTSVNSQMIKYLLKNEMPLTVQNMYNAMYMCGVEHVEETNIYKDKIFESVIPQVKDIVKESGFEWNADMHERTKWLFRNDIAINTQVLCNQDVLLELSAGEIDDTKILDNMTYSFAEGKDPSQVNVFDIHYIQARQAVMDFSSISDEALTYVINNNQKINLLNMRSYNNTQTNEQGVQRTSVKSSDDAKMTLITARRQLEEIRLSMTISAAGLLNEKGINVDTSELSKIVDGLRQIERDYYKNMLQSGGLEGTDDEISIMSETAYCRTQIGRAPSYILNDIAADNMKQTLPECADSAASLEAVYNRAGETYEKLMTVPRSDLGDSIQKAFSNVDSIIESTGLEVTAENQRIVKVLAHNQMEITADNIDKLKTYDAKMQYLLNNLKPDTTLDLIRGGNNPLEMSMDELNTAIAGINKNLSEQNQDKGESGYARFLWKLEKENRISPEERKSYIGIYRLLNHVTKNDTAAVGAVVNLGMDFNLKNLMTAVRSRRDSGIDAVIDDSSGLYDSKSDNENIDDQINTAFDYTYEQYTIDKMAADVTPAKLFDVSNGSLDDIMEQPIEKLCDIIESLSGDESLDSDYYEQFANNCREITNDNRILDYLNGFDVNTTLYNANCASQIIETGQTVLIDILKHKSISNEHTGSDVENEYEEEVNKLVDALDNDEYMQAQVDKTGDAARKLLMESDQGILNADDLASLRKMESALRFNGIMSRKRSYEIPIKTEGGITNINLTLLSTGNNKGKVEIRMDTETYGNVAVSCGVKGNKVQGMVLSESKDLFQSGLLNDIRDGIEGIGLDVISLSNGVHKVSGAYIPDRGDRSADGAAGETANLYKLAKSVVQTISRKL